MAESGQIKAAVCYAALDCSGDNFTVGVLRDETTGLHDMIGLGPNTQRFVSGEAEGLASTQRGCRIGKCFGKAVCSISHD